MYHDQAASVTDAKSACARLAGQGKERQADTTSKGLQVKPTKETRKNQPTNLHVGIQCEVKLGGLPFALHVYSISFLPVWFSSIHWDKCRRAVLNLHSSCCQQKSTLWTGQFGRPTSGNSVWPFFCATFGVWQTMPYYSSKGMKFQFVFELMRGALNLQGVCQTTNCNTMDKQSYCILLSTCVDKELDKQWLGDWSWLKSHSWRYRKRSYRILKHLVKGITNVGCPWARFRCLLPFLPSVPSSHLVKIIRHLTLVWSITIKLSRIFCRTVNPE